MKIYEVDGRKVWLDKAPEGYEVKKTEKVEPKVEEPKVDPIKEEEPKTTTTTAMTSAIIRIS